MAVEQDGLAWFEHYRAPILTAMTFGDIRVDIPGYQIGRQIGQGGMATVYLAIQESLGREVALKVMNPNFSADSSFSDRFMKESRIVAGFQHPLIVTVYDFGSRNEHFYFSMEYLSGGTLKERIASGIAIDESVGMIRQIADALGYAHEQGVIHRDIKPQNILFRQNGTPVLTDFGIAKRLNATTQITRTNVSVGSPGYMSPEQVNSRPMDFRADLYSLGVVFYEMLTRRLPYQADDFVSMAVMHCTAPIPTLPGHLTEFQPLIEWLLAKDPKDRPDSVSEFLATLDRIEVDTSGSVSLTETIDLVNAKSALRLQSSCRSVPDMSDGSVTRNPKSRRGYIGLLAFVLLAIPIYWVSNQYLHEGSRSNNYLEYLDFPAVSQDRPAVALEYERQALAHLEKNEFLASIESIGSGLEKAPSDARLLAMKDQVPRLQEAARLLDEALELSRENRLDESIAVLDRALKSFPDHEALSRVRSRIQAELIQLRHTRASTLLSHANAMISQGDLEGALATIEEGLQQVKDDVDLLNLRKQVRVKMERRHRIEMILTQARRLERDGKLEESLKLVKTGLKEFPEHPSLVDLKSRLQPKIEEDKRTEHVRHLLETCSTRFPVAKLVAEDALNALDCYRQLSGYESDSEDVRIALDRLANRYADWVIAAIGDGRLDEAQRQLEYLSKIRSRDDRISSLKKDLRLAQWRRAGLGAAVDHHGLSNWEAIKRLNPSDGAFRVDGYVHSPVFIGESIRFNVTSQESGRLWILSVDQRDRVNLIFPNEQANDNRVVAEETLVFPPYGADWVIEAAEPVGENIVAFLVFDSDVGLLDIIDSGSENRIGEQLIERMGVNDHWGVDIRILEVCQVPEDCIHAF